MIILLNNYSKAFKMCSKQAKAEKALKISLTCHCQYRSHHLHIIQNYD